MSEDLVLSQKRCSASIAGRGMKAVGAFTVLLDCDGSALTSQDE